MSARRDARVRGDDDGLHRALVESQRLGFLGKRPIDEVIAHARLFVEALGGNDSTRPMSVIDLGAGGGTPGLVIANDLPHVLVTLVDRRAKRTDFLEQMVHRLGWTDRVTVLCDDAHRVARRHAGSFDAAVARGFGPPTETIRLGAGLVTAGGRIVISEPPTGDRWETDLLTELALTPVHLDRAAGRVVMFKTAQQPADQG